MQARRSSKKDKVQFATNKLIGYGFDVDNGMKEELVFLNNILDDLEIREDITQARWGQILIFLRKYVKRYEKLLS